MSRKRPNRIRKLISLNLRRLRELRNLNQQELADSSGLSRNMVTLLETERTFPSCESLEALSRALKVTPASLFKEPSAFADNGKPLLNLIDNSEDLISFSSVLLRQKPLLQKIVMALVLEDERYLAGQREEAKAYLKTFVNLA